MASERERNKIHSHLRTAKYSTQLYSSPAFQAPTLSDPYSRALNPADTFHPITESLRSYQFSSARLFIYLSSR